jgi:hypothetical protein
LSLLSEVVKSVPSKKSRVVWTDRFTVQEWHEIVAAVDEGRSVIGLYRALKDAFANKLLGVRFDQFKAAVYNRRRPESQVQGFEGTKYSSLGDQAVAAVKADGVEDDGLSVAEALEEKPGKDQGIPF